MKTLAIIAALLLSITGAAAHPNHTCHSHGTHTHCK